MSDVKFTIDATKARIKLKKLKNLDEAIGRQLTSWGGKTQKRIFRNITGVILGKDKSKSRTGALGRSIGQKLIRTKNHFILEIGSGAGLSAGMKPTKPVKYARIHEKGGKIRPKKAKMLTVPFPGVKGLAKDHPGAFIIKSKKGNILMVERRGKKGLKLLFSLKKEVTIPASKWLSGSIDEMKPDLYNYLKPTTLLKIMDRMRR